MMDSMFECIHTQHSCHGSGMKGGTELSDSPIHTCIPNVTPTVSV